MTNWFIMAAGSAERCNGDMKHLFKVNGETIYHRTIRLIKSVDPDPEIYVISWNKELLRSDVEFIDTGGPTKCLNVSMLYSVPYWGDYNAILTGDAIFSEELIKVIYDNSHITQCYGRYADKKHGGPERYALTFGWDDCERIKANMKVCANHGLCNELPCCITDSIWMDIFAALQNTLSPINRKLKAKTNAGIMGFVYCRTWLAKYLASKVRMVEVTDIRVRDIDTHEELETLGKLWEIK